MPISPAFSEKSLVLDTDVLTHLRNRQPYAVNLVNEYVIRLSKPPTLTSMTVFEALDGIEKEVVNGNLSEERAQGFRERIEVLSREYGVLPFDGTAAKLAAHVFQRLSRKERKDHWKDLFIAATAIAHKHGVASGNRRDFELIARHLPDNMILPFAEWKP